MREEERLRQEQIQEQEAAEESDKFASEDSDQEVAKGEENKDGAVSNVITSYYSRNKSGRSCSWPSRRPAILTKA